MKLGAQTGSLTNHILSRSTIGQPKPEVGMGATILAWTDRYPGTISDVTTHRGQVVIFVKQDHAKRVDKNGLSECQEWAFEFNPDADPRIFRQRKDGSWEQVCYNADTGRYIKCDGYGLRIGERDKYHDFSF